MRKFAAFDIDGTLIRWQLYHAVVDRLAKDGQLDAGAHKRLHQARMTWKRREHPEAFKAYEQELISIFESALPELSPAIFDKTVKAIISEYADQVYTYTRDLIAELRAKGYFLLAISGSHQELVEQIAKHYGFDAWQGSHYERRDDHFSGKSHVPSQDKRSVLERLIKEHDLTGEDSWAVGDSASDAPMLQMVANPVAFNPDRDLFKLAKKNGWKIVLERKNMIYQLEQSHGQYVLL